MNKNDTLVKGAVAIIVGGCVVRAIQAIKKPKLKEEEDIIEIDVSEDEQ